MDFSILSLFAVRPAIYSDPINDENVFHIPGFVVTQAVMSWKTGSVATLSILAAKMMKRELLKPKFVFSQSFTFTGVLTV
ncbi:MAG: hypothetical protein QMD13_07755 [Candidatus Bathyarchaeia archaeon]|nr:hypothetical protein [Candidatus Bathyarchaeia archaeon]